jgi:hypothetical protein
MIVVWIDILNIISNYLQESNQTYLIPNPNGIPSDEGYSGFLKRNPILA